MTDPIVRMYETEAQARGAASKLKDKGLAEDRILVVTQQAGGGGGSLEAIASAIMAGHILRGQAKVYAEAVRSGRSLVIVRAPFGTGKRVIYLLDRFGPVDSGIKTAPRRSPAWDEAEPLSSALQVPPLAGRRPAPFSALFGLHTLSRGRTFQARYPELTTPAWTFSARLGLRLLSRRTTPWASLRGRSGPAWTRSFGLPMLSDTAAPLSSKLGMHLLTRPLPPHYPAPFSHRLGLPVLSPGRTVLSRLLGGLASPRLALFGRNPLIRNAVPLSSLIGKPVLLVAPAPLSAKLGRPVLMAERTPLSSRLGLPLLWRSGTPLSSLLWLPVLTRYQ
ncbi:MAG: hypothetical protein MUC77_19290 [Chromatiaceae bacterium]|jgi:hypothetical protein|nr:hypothetical protein [Chromatiaceae bacterium]